MWKLGWCDEVCEVGVVLRVWCFDGLFVFVEFVKEVDLVELDVEIEF